LINGETPVDVLASLKLLDKQCRVKAHDHQMKAQRLREEAARLPNDEEVYSGVQFMNGPRDDEDARRSGRQLRDQERRRLEGLAEKEEAAAERDLARATYAGNGFLLLGPDELADPDTYPAGLYDAAIAAKVAYITSDRVPPLSDVSAEDYRGS
jgi:hypothetical protein